MADPFLVAAPVAIIPAMAGMWWMLRRYEGLLDEARIFFALVVGLFVGVAVAAMESTLFAFPTPQFQAQATPMGSLLFTILGYALFETGAKAIFLGMRRFRGRPDTPFYGAPLGLTMGAMMAMHLIAAWLEQRPFGLLEGTAMVATPLSLVFVHGAAGAWVGQGSAQGRLGRGWAIGMGVQMPALAVYWFFLQAGPTFWLLALVGVAYAVVVWWITRTRLLEKVVPKDIHDQVRRDRRRARRRPQSDE